MVFVVVALLNCSVGTGIVILTMVTIRTKVSSVAIVYPYKLVTVKLEINNIAVLTFLTILSYYITTF